MKTYDQFITEAKALWPGTPEYKKAFPDTEDSGGKRTPGKTRGNLHDIKTTDTGVVATRRYSKDGESAEPVKPAAPVEKRGRGRPAGAYGTYNKSAKKRVAEAYEILESLEDEEEIDQFIADLDEETIMELSEMLDEKVHSEDEDEDEDEDEAEQLDELKKSTVKSYQSGREKEVTSMATRAMWDPNFRKKGPSKDEYPSLKKSAAVRDKNFMAAARRLSGKIPTSK